jgi:SAM-dependent methyltransferase
MSDWPGEEYRHPKKGIWNWSLREPLARWLEDEGRSVSGLRVLDIGCGIKPYFPYFSTALDYVGIDLAGNPVADVIGAIEQLPLDDASFDVVLCLQVLEHCEDPARAVAEMHRVVKPGGRILAATHGTYVYHPSPVDYWRWTHTGLERLFQTNAEWESVTVTAGAGTTACLGLLVATYVDLLFHYGHADWAGRIVNHGVNTLAAALDSRSQKLHELVPGSLTTNFHLTAVRA